MIYFEDASSLQVNSRFGCLLVCCHIIRGRQTHLQRLEVLKVILGPSFVVKTSFLVANRGLVWLKERLLPESFEYVFWTCPPFKLPKKHVGVTNFLPNVKK